MRPTKTAREEAEALYAEGLRFCTMCRESKPLESFDKYKRGMFGLRSNCRDCMNLRSQVWYHKNKDLDKRAELRKKRREAMTPRERHIQNFKRSLKYRYNLTLDQWHEMLIDRQGRCDICNRPMIGYMNLHVDHNHSTGEVRGMLCSKCNQGVGSFDDDPDRLRSAATYLE